MLYLEETYPKNYTSCLKDDKFLDFFFNALKPNDTGKLLEYPWVSPCWGEANYVKVYKHPIVFRQLIDNQYLWGGTLKVPFDPSKLVIDSSGCLLHYLDDN